MQMIDQDLKEYGLSTTFFTDEQKILILEPVHGPENFMCDGEISYEEAKRSWQQRLVDSGLSHPVVANIVNTILAPGEYV
jgi:hypothetical protein